MATPHVSGLAALILSRNPNLTPDQVRAIIESTAEDLGPAGRDIYFGAGRINMTRALAATPPGGDPPPIPTPGPGLDMDLPGCTQLLGNGGFEAGLANWETAGAVEVVSIPVSAGQASLHFKGGAGAAGVVTHTLTIPSGANAALLRFDYRIDPKDYGRGVSPDWPFDDWFTAEWRSATGASLGELLRTGNTADTVTAGLEWDHYIYRLSAADLAALAAAGPLELAFTSQNDSDSYPTDFWVDAVSFCAAGGSSSSYKMYWPLIVKP
jgi:subtilisin family serine protease